MCASQRIPAPKLPSAAGDSLEEDPRPSEGILARHGQAEIGRTVLAREHAIAARRAWRDGTLESRSQRTRLFLSRQPVCLAD